MKFMYDALKPRYDQSKYKDVGVEHVNLNQPIIVETEWILNRWRVICFLTF